MINYKVIIFKLFWNITEFSALLVLLFYYFIHANNNLFNAIVLKHIYELATLRTRFVFVCV